MPWKLINDIVKPWDELNALLVQRYAFQPDLSDVSNRIGTLSVSIKHQVDALALEQPHKSTKSWQETTDKENTSARIISDLADTVKHLTLRDARRQCSTAVIAQFECNDEEQFRFLRNAIMLTHASLGTHDFLAVALDAIQFWIRKRRVQVNFDRKILEAPPEFFPTAHLTFDSRYCLLMSETRIQFFRRDKNGVLIPHSPGNVTFVVH